MQIQIVLENQRADLTALQVARFLADLQHLTSVSIVLAHGDNGPDFGRVNDLQDTYDFKINADRVFDNSSPAAGTPVAYQTSPPQQPAKYKGGFFFRGSGKTLRGILDVIKTIVTLDHVRRGAAIENEARAEEVLRLRLKNYEQILKISSRFASPAERDAVERSVARAILPFVDGRYPAVKEMEVIEPR